MICIIIKHHHLAAQQHNVTTNLETNRIKQLLLLLQGRGAVGRERHVGSNTVRVTQPAAAAARGLSTTSGEVRKSTDRQVSGDALIPSCKNLVVSQMKEIGTPPTAAVGIWALPPGSGNDNDEMK